MIHILFAIVMCSCTVVVHDPSPDGPSAPDARSFQHEAWTLPATIRAVGDAVWSKQLADTVRDMNYGISAVSACPDTFVVVASDQPADHDVELVSSCDGIEPGMVGAEDGERIVIHGNASAPWQESPLLGVLEHELGHAIGLSHADPLAGGSVMTLPSGPQMVAKDAAAFACRLGCGPCAQVVDPYDR